MTDAEVVIAEDSKIQAILLRRILEEQGYRVRAGENGKKALDLILERAPDIVLTDVNMPEMDGFELCHRLKADPATASIPVILVTSLQAPDEIADGARAGADDYVIKPYQADYLLAKVETILTNRVEAPQVDTSDPATSQRIYKLLTSTYENAVEQNKQLRAAQTQLDETNTELKGLVDTLRNTKEELHESEQLFRSTLSRLPDVVFRIDKNGIIKFANDAVGRLGLDKKALIDQHFHLLLAESSRADASNLLNELNRLENQEERLGLLEAGPIEIDTIYRETSLAAGEWLTCELKLIGFPGYTDRSGVGSIIGMLHDVTSLKAHQAYLEGANQLLEDRVADRTKALSLVNSQLSEAFEELERTQSQVVQSEKMSAIGTLVAGVAHEMNNPLMGSMNYIEYLKDHSDNEKHIEYLDKAYGGVSRAVQILKGLLTFSRPGDAELVKVECRESINAMLDLLEADLRHKDIVVTLNVPDDLPPVQANTVGLQQILLNLLINARDALANRSEGRSIIIEGTAEADSITLSVRDNAGGIPPEIVKRIFDPFFTTKEVGKGTGLGLAISRNLMRDFGGELRCITEVGKGTQFLLEFPRR